MKDEVGSKRIDPIAARERAKNRISKSRQNLLHKEKAKNKSPLAPSYIMVPGQG